MTNRYFIVDKNLSIKQKKTFEINKKNKKNTTKFSLEIYQEVGYYIITPIIIGVFVGLSLDRYFNTKTIFTIGLIFIGSIFTFYNLYQIYKKNQ